MAGGLGGDISWGARKWKADIEASKPLELTEQTPVQIRTSLIAATNAKWWLTFSRLTCTYGGGALLRTVTRRCAPPCHRHPPTNRSRLQSQTRTTISSTQTTNRIRTRHGLRGDYCHAGERLLPRQVRHVQQDHLEGTQRLSPLPAVLVLVHTPSDASTMRSFWMPFLLFWIPSTNHRAIPPRSARARALISHAARSRTFATAAFPFPSCPLSFPFDSIGLLRPHVVRGMPGHHVRLARWPGAVLARARGASPSILPSYCSAPVVCMYRN